MSRGFFFSFFSPERMGARRRTMLLSAIALAALLSIGIALAQAGNPLKYTIPEMTATESIDGTSARALTFGHSWYDGKNSFIADAIAPWQGKYTDENILIIGGAPEQSMIALAVDTPAFASYSIYLPDGTVYDDGKRDIGSSLSPRLFWADNRSSINIIAPFEPGEYIYAVTLRWTEHDRRTTYGLKIIVTGARSAFDEALRVLREHRYGLMAVAYAGVEKLPGAEHAGDCYVFDYMLPTGTERVAVSKERSLLFTCDDGVWHEKIKTSRERYAIPQVSHL